MNIKVMSREKAIQYCNKQHQEKSIIVSIYSPLEDYESKPFITDVNRVVDILEVGFYDIDYDYPSNNGKMNIIDAKLIANFIEQYKDLLIIIHCDYGCSRSAGIAAALAKHYNNDDDLYFNHSFYQPNMLCYRLMLMALGDYII